MAAATTALPLAAATGLALGSAAWLLARRLRPELTATGPQRAAPWVLTALACSGATALARASLGPGWLWELHAVILALLVCASVLDLFTGRLPDVLVLPAGLLALAGAAMVPGALAPSATGALAGGAAFWLTARTGRVLLGREVLGAGDVKLACALGALTGLRLLPLAIMLGCAAALACAPLVRRPSGHGLLTHAIPFGPFLTLGAILALYRGRAILDALPLAP